MLSPSTPVSGTDDKAIVDVLAGRSNAQRQFIRAYYKTAFGRVRATT